MKKILALLTILLAACSSPQPANAQSTAEQIQLGFLSQTGCHGLTPCWIPYSSSNPFPIGIIGPISNVVNLGTSTSATSPRITGDATSGFYTAGAGLVDISALGSQEAEFSSTGIKFFDPVGIGAALTSITAGAALDLSSNTTSSNSSLLLPIGSSAARPTGVNGMIRYNSSTNSAEGFINGAWGSIGGGVIGSVLSSGQIFVGSASNLAAAVTPSLDVSLANTGAFTVNSYGGGNVPGSSCAANTGITGGTVPLLNSNNISFSGTGDNFTNPIAIGSTSITAGAALDLGTNTSSLLLPVGTTGQRPGTGVNGMMRYNSTLTTVEGYLNGGWEPVSPYYPVDTNATGNSVALGQQALSGQTVSGGYANTAIGYQAIGLAALTTTAINNTAVGSAALGRLTTGQRNTAVGSQALDFLTTGQFNTLVGRTSGGGAGSTALTGNDNTGMGDSTLGNIQGIAADNTAFGFKALNGVTTGIDNTAVGSLAGNLVTTGGSNTILGFQVGSTTITTGSNNVLIGTSSTTTTSGAAVTNEIHIGAGAGDIFSATGAGTASTSIPVVAGTVDMPNLASTSTGQTGTVCWLTGSGATAGRLTVDTTTTCLLSLEEMKDIRGPIKGALSIVKELNPFWFSWKKDTQEYFGDTAIQPGLGAHQVASVDKRLAAYDPQGNLHGVRYQELTAVLVAAINEQQSQIEELKTSKGIGHSCFFGLLICAD